jgi:hypothetical protein
MWWPHLARFSARLKFQDRAQCGNKENLKKNGSVEGIHLSCIRHGASQHNTPFARYDCSVFLSHLKEGNVIEEREKLSVGWLKFPADPDKISLGGKWVFPQKVYQILVP